MMFGNVPCAALVFALIQAAAFSAEPVRADHPKDTFNPKTEVDEFVTAVDFQDMRRYPKHWSMELSPKRRKQILLELLQRLRNTHEGRIENYTDMFVLSRIQTGKMKWYGHGLKFEQDIFLVNGRCAWAIEQILDCYLPNFTAEVAHDPKKLDENVRLSFLKVIEAMEMPEKPKPVQPKPESGHQHFYAKPPVMIEKTSPKNERGKKNSAPRDKTEKKIPFSKDF